MPSLYPMVSLEIGEGCPYIAILLNGKNMREMEALATILSDGDEVVIFPPVSGG